MAETVKECTASDIVPILNKASCTLRRNLHPLMLSLRIKEPNTKMNNLNQRPEALTVVLFEMVEEWRNKQDSIAKLSDLTEALRDNGLASVANDLEEEFGKTAVIVSPDANNPIIPKQNAISDLEAPSSTVDRVSIEHSTRKIASNIENIMAAEFISDEGGISSNKSSSKSDLDNQEEEVLVENESIPRVPLLVNVNKPLDSRDNLQQISGAKPGLRDEIKRKNRKKYALIFSGVLIFILALGLVWFVYNYLKKKPNELIPVTFTTGSPNNTLQSTNSNVLNIIAESYIEYETKVTSTSHFNFIQLYINSSKLSSWSGRKILSHADKIKTLYIEGSISLASLFFILSQLNNVTSITLSNRFGMLCKETDYLEDIPVYKLNLSSLRSLELKEFENCYCLLEAVVLRFDFHLITTLRFSGVLNVDTRDQLLQLFKKSNDALNEISFNIMRFDMTESLFESDSNVRLFEVRNITINWENNAYKSADFISPQFCQVMKGLAYFTELHDYISLAEFKHLLNCRELLGIYVNMEHREEISVILNVQDGPPFLSTLFINTNAENCHDSTIYNDMMTSNVEWIKNIKNFTIC